jgi:hypothetical protein
MNRLLLALTLFIACTESVPSETGDTFVVIRSETSFGMCMGYCRTELFIDRLDARLTYRSHEVQAYPPRTYTIELTLGEWRQLVDVTDRQAFLRLDSVYGCPDCADGGAEAVELEWSGERRRVLFEYGNPPASIRALRDRIWQVRNRFPARPD